MRNLPRHQFCAALVVGALVTSVGAAPSKLSHDLAALASSGGSGNVDVIIQGDAQAMTRVRYRVSQHGGTAGRALAFVNGMAASVPASELPDLASDAGVLRISADRPLAAAVNVNGQSGGSSASRPAALSASLTGRGVGVAVVDSGIYPHEDLGDAVALRLDFVDPSRRGSDLTEDPYGHGTHVAGIVSALAPGARLVSLRVLDHKGAGKSSDVIAALDWCVQHQADFGLRVVNLSLGQAVAEASADDPLNQAVERAWRSGLVVVTAAGNAGLLGSGYGMISSPANDPLVIAVGALDDHGTVSADDDDAAPFSSKGPTRFDFMLKPDLVAPGTHIVSLRVPHSTLDRNIPDARVSAMGVGGLGRTFDPLYFEMSGSSMAAAEVSGAVAVMLESNPTLTPEDVKARFMRHAMHFGSQDVFTRGAGAMDFPATLSAVERASASPSPAVSLSGAGDAVTIEDTGAAWGSASLWSLEDLYGDNALWNTDAALDNALFDDACMTGQGLTWQHAVANGVIWQHAVAEGIIWQTLTSEGITWQHLSGSGLTWQHSYGDGTCPF